MRQIKCFDLHGVTVEDVLNELNERQAELSDEFGFSEESDIISISTRTVAEPHDIYQPKGTRKSTVIVTVFLRLRSDSIFNTCRRKTWMTSHRWCSLSVEKRSMRVVGRR